MYLVFAWSTPSQTQIHLTWMDKFDGRIQLDAHSWLSLYFRFQLKKYTYLLSPLLKPAEDLSRVPVLFRVRIWLFLYQISELVPEPIQWNLDGHVVAERPDSMGKDVHHIVYRQVAKEALIVNDEFKVREVEPS